MLDKETVKIRNRQCDNSDMQFECEDHLVKCLEKAKKYVDEEEIEECFDRALGLESIRRLS